jgi:hypothetical protein
MCCIEFSLSLEGLIAYLICNKILIRNTVYFKYLPYLLENV